MSESQKETFAKSRILNEPVHLDWCPSWLTPVLTDSLQQDLSVKGVCSSLFVLGVSALMPGKGLSELLSS